MSATATGDETSRIGVGTGNETDGRRGIDSNIVTRPCEEKYVIG